MDVYELRRANLRALVEQWSGPKPLAEKLGYNQASFIVQMAGPNPSRDVTEKTAMRIEVALDLPVGWMDRDINNGTAPHVDSDLVTAAIRITADLAL